MTKTQAVDLPPWKIVIWLPKVYHRLELIKLEIDHFKYDLENLSERFFPSLQNIYIIFSNYSLNFKYSS